MELQSLISSKMNPFVYMAGRSGEDDDEDDVDFQMRHLRERIKASSANLLALFNGDLRLTRISGGSCFNGVKDLIIHPESW